MEIIGIGNLVCDIYYEDNKTFAINGGQTWANIIFNLANMNINTKVIGNVGDDYFGKIAIDSLNKVGVNTSKIKILNRKTNLFHISIIDKKVITKKRCPICNNKTWEDSFININIISKRNVIIIDRLKYLRELKDQIVMLDIGYPNELMNMNQEEIDYFLSFPFEILNFNIRIVSYLLERLNLSSVKELYRSLNTKVLLITRGKKGVTYLFDDQQIDLELTNIEEEIDPNGAGDMFFASTIRDYLDNDFSCDREFIINSFKTATKLSGEVVKLIGARTYYQEMYEIKDSEERCLCNKDIL